MSRKPRSPYFVKADLRKDGTVLLTDDDGEEYHVSMDRHSEWPILSSTTSNREMRRREEQRRKEEAKPMPTPTPFKPRLV